MNSTASITQNFIKNVDLITACRDESGQKTIYFNVSRVYEKFDIFVFESALEIRCGNVYYLKIKQTGHTKYDLGMLPLRVVEVQTTVNSLFDDTLVSIKDFRERDNARLQNTSVPDISLPVNFWEQYFSSPNYFDLLKSCTVISAG